MIRFSPSSELGGSNSASLSLSLFSLSLSLSLCSIDRSSREQTSCLTKAKIFFSSVLRSLSLSPFDYRSNFSFPLFSSVRHPYILLAGNYWFAPARTPGTFPWPLRLCFSKFGAKGGRKKLRVVPRSFVRV